MMLFELTETQMSLMVQAIVGLIVAVTGAINIWVANQAKKEARESKVETVKQGAQLNTIERQTNGIIHHVADSSHAAGVMEGKKQAASEAATVAALVVKEAAAVASIGINKAVQEIAQQKKPAPGPENK